MGLPSLDRRSLLKYASVSGLASLATACLSQNAPTTATASATPGIGAPATSAAQPQQTVTWKVQSGWAGNDLFQTMFLNWAKSVDEMSGGRLKIDTLPVNAVTNINGAIDAVHSGTLVQRKMKLNVIPFFHMPMQNQPLGWFKQEIKGPDDFKGMKFRTVGLATGIYQALGASVVSVSGAEVASALDRGTIDAAEFNNTTSDSVYGLPDTRPVLMARSYHQPSEILEITLNKTKYDAMPKDLQAIMRWSTVAASADSEWLQMAKNSDDYAALIKEGKKIIRTPQSVLDAQLKAWDTVIADKSKDNPEFVAILKSQKAWAERIFPWAFDINIPTPDKASFDARPKLQ